MFAQNVFLHSTLVMKKPALSSVLILLLSTPLFAQMDEIDFPSTGSMFGSLTSDGEKEVSLSEDIDAMVKALSDQAQARNTEESVRTAIVGPLVVEEVIPDINREIIEAIDRRTNRYSPRLRLDFESFPLVRTPPVGVSPSVERIAKLLQRRLRLEQPIVIELSERTVNLRGTVSTERQKELAAIILCFEPGVDNVNNELRVRE